MLLCTVRGCRGPLSRNDRRLVCLNGHSFDIARSGYINLLQPQDRRSKHPGDTPAALAARRRIHDRGTTEPLLQAIAELAAPTSDDIVLDAGCGEGFYLGSLAAQSGCRAHGIDISIPAIDAAARRYPACEWVVANADRFIPYEDAAFSLILSITGRMNPSEFHRVLRPDGRLLVAVSSPLDLIELRGAARDRTARTISDFAPHFTLIARTQTTTKADVDADAVQDILHSIYRLRRKTILDAVRPEQVTLSLDLLLFRPKPDTM